MFTHHIHLQQKEKTDGRTTRQDGPGHDAQESERSDAKDLSLLRAGFCQVSPPP